MKYLAFENNVFQGVSLESYRTGSPPLVGQPDDDPAFKTPPAKKGRIDKMNISKARQSMPDQSPGPHSTSGPSPATVALIFTVIVMQVQLTALGNARDLLPVLIAALLATAGVTPDHPGS
jgi:hypothetical protein